MNEALSDRLAALKTIFGQKLILEIDEEDKYCRDASEISVRPPAILFAQSEADVIAAVKFCRDQNIPIVFRGAGTGYTGGAIPVSNGLLLSFENLKKLELDYDRRIAFCGPGLITAELMKKAEEYSLFYPPDPASFEESTLGGNVAECAGGLHCKKYGVTKDYVIGLKMITADGITLQTGIYSDGGLFNITDVIIGSEGLLTAIVEIALRLIERPRMGPTILAAFSYMEDAARAVAEITRRGIIPSVMEFMDSDSVASSLEYEKPIDLDNVGAVLLLETTGDDCQVRSKEIERICRNYKTVYVRTESDPDKTSQLWKVRRNISNAVKASARQKTSEDVCVPPSKLPDLVAFVSRLNEEYPIRINSFGHAGDGTLHVNFLSQSDHEGEAALIRKAVKQLFLKTLQLGGTISGEHGIGLTKKEFLPLEFDGLTLKYMKIFKDAFDPQNLFNPGKMFLP
jgi:glycolate oxidase